MKENADELTEDNFDETLESLIKLQLVAVRQREGKEPGFYLTELGKATMENNGEIPFVYLRDD